MDLNIYVSDYLNQIKQICDLIDKENIISFINHIQVLKNRKGRLFIAGVGGSAANAAHAVNDFRKILNIESYSISENVSELTARINDESWETSYLNWLKVSQFGENDAILIFSVGGGTDKVSLNLVRCLEYASEIGSMKLSVVSRDGGKSKELSDCCVLIPVVDQEKITPHAEEWQGVILHLVVNALYKKI
jgi:D-sedoheptulose 7-phosphate isomerase